MEIKIAQTVDAVNCCWWDPLMPSIPFPFNYDTLPQVTTTYSQYISVYSLVTFRVVSTIAGVELSVDLPGVHPDDLKVENNSGTITAHGQRCDLLIPFFHQHVTNGEYDMSSAKANLLNGVLTVTLKRFKKSSKTIPVTVG